MSATRKSTGTRTVRFPPQIDAELDALAAAAGMTVSAYIACLVEGRRPRHRAATAALANLLVVSAAARRNPAVLADRSGSVLAELNRLVAELSSACLDELR